MNKKGIYTGIVGILALVLLSAALIFSLGPADDGKISVQSKAVQQLNLKMLNEYHLFDKAVVEGALDSVNLASCTWNGTAAATGTITDYIRNVDSRISECIAGEISTSGSSATNARLGFPVACSMKNETGAILASTTKNFTFNVRANPSGSPCSVTVTDLLAGSTVVYP